jgi:hypothetical protein
VPLIPSRERDRAIFGGRFIERSLPSANRCLDGKDKPASNFAPANFVPTIGSASLLEIETNKKAQQIAAGYPNDELLWFFRFNKNYDSGVWFVFGVIRPYVDNQN